MKKPDFRRRWPGAALFLALLAIDQGAAWVMESHYPALVSSRPLQGYFNGWQRQALAALLLLAIARGYRLRAAWWCLPLLAAGILGNALTYWRLGRYVDYLPAFGSITNTADLCIAVGCIGLAYQVARKGMLLTPPSKERSS